MLLWRPNLKKCMIVALSQASLSFQRLIEGEKQKLMVRESQECSCIKESTILELLLDDQSTRLVWFAKKHPFKGLRA